MVSVSIRASDENEINRISSFLRQQGLRRCGNTKHKDFYVTAKFQGTLRDLNRVPDVLTRNQSKYSTTDD